MEMPRVLDKNMLFPSCNFPIMCQVLQDKESYHGFPTSLTIVCLKSWGAKPLWPACRRMSLRMNTKMFGAAGHWPLIKCHSFSHLFPSVAFLGTVFFVWTNCRIFDVSETIGANDYCRTGYQRWHLFSNQGVDLEAIADLGANTVRLYNVNPQNNHSKFMEKAPVSGQLQVVDDNRW